MSSTLQIDGIDVFVEGEGNETIAMIHGWPDTYRLWDTQVAFLQGALPLRSLHAAGLRHRQAAPSVFTGADDHHLQEHHPTDLPRPESRFDGA
jgi:pimeloyl-ACP methyl ester carboxylesterase